MAASPDGSSVVSAGADATLRFWDIFGGPPEKNHEHARQHAMPSVVLGSNQPLPQIPHGAGSSSNNNNNVGGRGGGGGGGGSGGMMGAGGNMEGVDDSFRESPFYVPEIPSFGTRSPKRGSRS